MTSLLDIIGASVIGGMLLVILLTATSTGTREFLNYNSDAIVQQQLAQMAYIIEYDLRKMGYDIKEAQKHTIIQAATSNHIKFLSQLNSGEDVIPDTVEYSILPAETINYGDTTIIMYKIKRTLKVSQQPLDQIVIGKIGNASVFRYLDQIGNPVDIIQATKMVEVTLVALNPQVVLSKEFVSSQLDSAQNAEFRKQELKRLLRPSFWRQTRLVSKNLKR